MEQGEQVGMLRATDASITTEHSWLVFTNISSFQAAKLQRSLSCSVMVGIISQACRIYSNPADKP
jgi:hypothetical protein